MIKSIFRRRPDATAIICGNGDYPEIRGSIKLYQSKNGVFLVSEVQGLPWKSNSVFAYHIHEGSCCSGNENDPFADALTHYNPDGNPHPYHAGDMPPLFSNCGYAFSAFFTNRFCLKEVIGKTVIIHSSPDDFTTQPAGNSGVKIACGIIKKQKRL